MRKFLSLFLVLFTLTFTFTLTCSAETLSDEILAQGKAEADLFLTLKQALGLDWIDEYNAYLSDPTTNPAPAWDTSIANLVSQGYLSSSFPTDFTIALTGQEVTISRTVSQAALREAMAIYLPAMTVSGDVVSLLVQRPAQWIAYETALNGKVSRDGSDNPDILPNSSLDFGSNSQINFVSGDGKILGVNSLFYKTQELDNRFVNITGDTMTGILTAAGFKVGSNNVWHQGNDGSGSGLDADLLDGQDSAFYRNASNINAGTLNPARLSGTYGISITGNAATATNADKLDGQDSAFYRNASNLNAGTVPTGRLSGTYGIDISGKAATAGNAEKLDGRNSTQFAYISDTYSATVSSAGWYTIATVPTGRAFAEFYVWDTSTSGRHNSVKLIASTSFGKNNIAVINGNSFGPRSIAHARILYKTSDRTYGGAKLQVYCENPSYTLNVRSTMDKQMTGWTGWNVITPVKEDTPSGWAEDTVTRREDITNYAFVGNVKGNITGKSSDSDKLGGQLPDFYQNASNINAGTLNPARLSGTYGISITGNAATASKLATARTIALAGNASGSASFDGSGNITINTTVSQAANADTVDNKHYSDLQNEFVNVAGDTATGPIYFQGGLSAEAQTRDIITTRTPSGFWQTNSATTGKGWPQTTNSWYHLLSSTHSNTGNYYSMQFAGNFYNSSDIYYRSTNGSGTTPWNKMWHSGNDGSGSGLDADLLDGQDSAFYRNASNLNTGVVPAARLSGTYGISITGNAATATNADKLDGYHHDAFVKRAGDTMTGKLTAPEYNINDSNTRIYEGGTNSVRLQTNYGYVDIGPQNASLAHFYTDMPAFYFSKPVEAVTHLKVYGTNTYFTSSAGYISGSKVWTQGNDGSGSGLDADLLDGKDSSAFALAHDHPYVSKAGDTMTGTLTAPGYQINDANTKISEGSNNSVRIQTNSGYVDIGPQNTGWAHFNTDRPEFYFSKPVEAEGMLKIYNTGTYLTGTEGKIAGNKVWHAGNDGTGSGLDADLLDGKHASELFGAMPIGVPFPVWDHLSSSVIPPNSGSIIYIKLTAGESGPGGYNYGHLHSESVTGTAPLVQATAVIAVGPLAGKTVHLINTEEAFIRATTVSGTLQYDQLQRMTGSVTFGRENSSHSYTGVFSGSSSSGGPVTGRGASKHSTGILRFDSANSARSGTETRPKNVSATWYMRIQ